MPRHQVTMVDSSLIALSSIQNLVFLRMIRKIRMISAGPAANAVAMKRIGIMLWNHIGRAGIVAIRKAVTVWMRQRPDDRDVHQRHEQLLVHRLAGVLATYR